MVNRIVGRKWRTSRTAAAIFTVAALTSLAAAKSVSPLSTADENAVETLAVELLKSPEVADAQKSVIVQFEATEPNASDAEKAVIRNAVHELAFNVALYAANSDTERPKLALYQTPPRKAFGHDVPGSRWGDNPDNAYRFAVIDPASKYELIVHPKNPGPTQYSFIIYDNYIAETGSYRTIDTPIAVLRDRDIKAAADGSFKITIDSEPANGRPNHLQNTPKGKVLLLRNSLTDWASQNALTVEIHRVGGPLPAPSASKQTLARLTADYLEKGAKTILTFKSIGSNANGQVNTLINPPRARGGAWGFGSGGAFKFASDEAIVLTLDPSQAKYLSVVLLDPWMVSRATDRTNGSLNNYQAELSKDGTITYVIAAKDPGIHNWLDTGGLQEGLLTIRWQAFPPEVSSIDGAIKQFKAVKLGELSALLPKEATKVTPEQRRKDYTTRAESYAHRYQ